MISPTNPSANDLSIVIVTFNSASYLQGCLDSIFGNDLYGIQITVVDNASLDNVKSICESYPSIDLICNDENLGFAKAVNLGIKASRRRYILLLNPDTVLPPYCLSELIEVIESQPQIGMIGPMLVKENGKIDLACRRNFPTPRDIIFRAFSVDRLFPKSKFFNHYTPTYTDMNLAGEVECISGAFMLVRKKAVNDVGFLDETYFLYGEDVDWAYRFKLANWKVYYCPTVKVLHYKRGSSKQSTTSKTICAFYESAYHYYEKYLAPQNSIFTNTIIRLSFSLRKYVSLIGFKVTKKWL